MVLPCHFYNNYGASPKVRSPKVGRINGAALSGKTAIQTKNLISLSDFQTRGFTDLFYLFPVLLHQCTVKQFASKNEGIIVK